MKSIFESPEIMSAYAQIDLCYYMLKELAEEKDTRSGLEVMIDTSTGYEKVKNKESFNQTIDALETIIKNKKIVEADYSKDEMYLKEVKSIYEFS